MPSRPSSYLVPKSLDDLVTVKRFLSGVMEQIDVLNGNIARNVEDTKVAGVVTEDQLTPITAQIAEQKTKLSDYITLSQETLDSIIETLGKLGTTTENSGVLDSVDIRVGSAAAIANANALGIGDYLNKSNSVFTRQAALETDLANITNKVDRLRYWK